ncbi:hypothetical protein [Pseudomonas kurunegalensis]|uniref:hypothetical protein n=1 Tax=Pseudomonas kurunegalensis TaxID=485880 RepID=UPI00256FFD66|nr:hypothetical protein [Pseudomonas kurunegalensis]WJD64846.1 hypothetical protein QQ992_11265 [Pseudomonas kurunegalensis]
MKDKNKNAVLVNDIHAGKPVYKLAFLCTVSVFGREMEGVERVQYQNMAGRLDAMMADMRQSGTGWQASLAHFTLQGSPTGTTRL